MTTTNLTRTNFESTIVDNPIVLVDFWASWCGPCRAFTPVCEHSAKMHPDIVHAKVDTEAEQELAGIIGIRSIPTTMAFLRRRAHLQPSRSDPTSPARGPDQPGQALDMEQVRAEIAARKAAATA